VTRFLVTGGAGFIGSHVARSLLDDGADVDVVDDLSTGSLENVPRGADFVELDLAGGTPPDRPTTPSGTDSKSRACQRTAPPLTRTTCPVR